jgi:hypothetical protein
MAIAYEEPSRLASFNRKLEYADPAALSDRLSTNRDLLWFLIAPLAFTQSTGL